MDIDKIYDNTNTRISRRQLIKIAGILLGSSLFPISAYAKNPDREVLYRKIVSDLKMTMDPDKNQPKDVWATPEQSILIHSCYDKLTKIQRFVGFANFNYIDFGSVVYFAKRERKTGRFFGTTPERTMPFTRKEIEFMRNIFELDARVYGFYGKKVTFDINQKINEREIVNMIGHYITKGSALDKYNMIKKSIGRLSDDYGNEIILRVTSGIRNLAKQMRLFYRKAIRLAQRPGETFLYTLDLDNGKKRLTEVEQLREKYNFLKNKITELEKRHMAYNLKKDERKDFLLSQGFHLLNLSAASRSLAPPGYSWHGRYDFDIGIKNTMYRQLNFDKRFITTPLFKELFTAGYINLADLRYQQHNGLGVRFEPWHIKVEQNATTNDLEQIAKSNIYIPKKDTIE
ncbi:MAG: D-alanyl-D-alanine carboxypeptidase family protein [Deltaproteobacteria bacterium]|nr:D-alanyl-D-alanine carboxypeptidase family protein [Deltaproteobacteria bacterium]MDL1961794.1 D-alanyl-D-alanine carboxypeptidase family protein [Deltaproteobacteria bacterium]